MNDLTDFLFGKKVLKKAAGETEAPKPTTTQSTDYVSEQIKKSRKAAEPSTEYDFNPERIKNTPVKKTTKPMAPTALDKLKKPQPKY